MKQQTNYILNLEKFKFYMVVLKAYIKSTNNNFDLVSKCLNSWNIRFMATLFNYRTIFFIIFFIKLNFITNLWSIKIKICSNWIIIAVW